MTSVDDWVAWWYAVAELAVDGTCDCCAAVVAELDVAG